MSRHTFLCRRCGALRRRELVYGPRAAESLAWPRCDDRPMAALRDIQGEAATKLRKAERLAWARAGLLVILEKGHWKAALTPTQRRRAAGQLADHRATEVAREKRRKAPRHPGGRTPLREKRLTRR